MRASALRGYEAHAPTVQLGATRTVVEVAIHQHR